MRLLFVMNGSIKTSKHHFSIEPGIDNFCLEIATLVDKLGIAAMNSNNTNTERTKNVNVKIDNAEIISHKKFGNKIFKKTISYILLLFRIPKYLNRYDYIYICYPGNISMLYIFWARILNYPFGLYIRGDLNENKWWNRILIKGSKFTLVTGDNFKKRFESIVSNIDIVTPMIDSNYLLSQYEFVKSSIENKVYNRNHIKVLFIGRISKEKGFNELLEALCEIKRQGNNISLDVIGSMKDSIDNSNISLNNISVRYHGFLPQNEKFWSIFKSADLLIFPTYYPEGFPRVVYEAMAMGVPVLTTKIGANASFCKPYHNFILIEPKNIKSIISAFEWIKNNSDEVKKVAYNALKDVSQVLRSRNKSHAQQVYEYISELNDKIK